jgi:hypothetical protein
MCTMATQVPENEHDPKNGDIKDEKADRIVQDEKIELQDTDAWDKLGYSFPTWRKWQILSKPVGDCAYTNTVY